MSSPLFGPDVRPSALMAVALINTSERRGGEERLTQTEVLTDLGRKCEIYYVPDGTEAELRAMRLLRDRLDHIIATTDQAEQIVMINELFLAAASTPQVVIHDEDPRPHFHYTLEDASYVDHLRGITAYAIARLLIMGELSRIRTCHGDDCNLMFFDVSRNGGRLYCDSRTCGNRMHAARFRARHNDTER